MTTANHKYALHSRSTSGLESDRMIRTLADAGYNFSENAASLKDSL
jgi:hypothetical protein